MKVVLDILGGYKEDKFINEFMHAADVYEEGKQYAQYFQLIVEGTPNLNELIPNILKTYNQLNGYIVFAAIRSIDDKRCNDHKGYFMENVQTISLNVDGTLKFCLFKDLLKYLGYDCLTDQKMYVVNFANKRTFIK